MAICKNLLLSLMLKNTVLQEHAMSRFLSGISAFWRRHQIIKMSMTHISSCTFHIQRDLTIKTTHVTVNILSYEVCFWTSFVSVCLEIYTFHTYTSLHTGVPFPRVRFSLLLKRKPMFYTINIITPCITMSLLALLVFYLPPDSGEKVSLGITVLLSFSVFLLLVAENVPKTSEFVPLLGRYWTFVNSHTHLVVRMSLGPNTPWKCTCLLRSDI